MDMTSAMEMGKKRRVNKKERNRETTYVEPKRGLTSRPPENTCDAGE